MKKLIMIIVIFICIVIIFCCCQVVNATSFDEYYNQWKKDNGVTKEIPYQNSTNEQKVDSVNEAIEEVFNKIRISDLEETVKEKQEEVDKYKNDIKNQNRTYIVIIVIVNILYIAVIIFMGVKIYKNKK